MRWLSLFRSGRDPLRARRTPLSTPRPRRALLTIETLEDRCVPATINVIGLADGAGTVAQTAPGVFSATTLRAAVNMASTDGNVSDTINLAVAGTYQVSAGELAYSGSHNLTIQNASGGAVTVRGNGLGRDFNINPGAQNTTAFTVTFQGFTITGGAAAPGDGSAGSGGGIRAQGAASIVLSGVTLVGNTATADGGGIALESVNNDSIGTLTILNSTIASNHAGDAGGGVESDGHGLVTINTSTIQDNTCVNQGAGVWLDAGGASLNMTDDVVRDNRAITMLAGGIGNAGAGNVTLVGCTIADNFSGGSGGGFGDAVNMGNLTVSNCLFLNNTAAGNGGGIQEGTTGVTKITGTVFDGNTSAGNGGGLFVSGNAALLTGNIFRHNTAVNGGGVEDEASTFIDSQSTYDANSALGQNGDNGNNVGPGGAGGAVNVAVGNAFGAIFTQDLFVRNIAGNGINGQGGAVADTAGILTVNQSQFTGNAAAGSGGAISFNGNVLRVLGSTFSNNTTFANGGAVSFTSASSSTFQSDTFVGNTAPGGNGGAIFDSASALVLVGDTINGNSAGSIGGGVAVFNGGSLSIQNTIVFGNTAGFGAPDVFSLTITDNRGNLIGIAPPGFGAGTLIGVDPKLGSLANNGGPFAGAPDEQQVVQTEALLPGSPAIGAGVRNGINTDERFFASPAGGRTTPSIGAFEFQSVTLAVAVTPVTVTLGQSAAVSVTVTNTSGNPLPADNTTLTVTLPAGLVPLGGTTFTVGALAAGRSVTFTVPVAATGVGAQTVTVTVTSPDANPGSVMASATVSVVPRSDPTTNAQPSTLIPNASVPADTVLSAPVGNFVFVSVTTGMHHGKKVRKLVVVNNSGLFILGRLVLSGLSLKQYGQLLGLNARQLQAIPMFNGAPAIDLFLAPGGSQTLQVPAGNGFAPFVVAGL
jgi:hypothetical protein